MIRLELWRPLGAAVPFTASIPGQPQFSREVLTLSLLTTASIPGQPDHSSHKLCPGQL